MNAVTCQVLRYRDVLQTEDSKCEAKTSCNHYLCAVVRGYKCNCITQVLQLQKRGIVSPFRPHTIPLVSVH